MEPRGKTAQLLALLVSHPDRPLDLGEIKQTLWPDERPELIKTKQVEKLVSDLRRLLGDSGRAAIPERKHDRYRLDATEGNIWVDALEFDRLAGAARERLESGDAAGARTAAVRALKLWESDPVVLSTEWDDLRERRQVLRLAAAQAALLAGEVAGAVAELRGYVQEHGRDERGWELLVEALLRGGRADEAHRTCAQAQERFDAGMGPRLRRLCEQAKELEPEPLTPPVDVPGRPRRRRRWMVVVASASVAVAAAVVSGSLVMDRDQDAPQGPVAPPVPGLAFDFDSGIHADGQDRYVVDTTGDRRGYEIGNSGGALTLVDHDQGKAVKFPPACGGRTTPDCPGAVVDVADAEVLDPGTRPFSYGADVLVDADDNAPTANIMQKGTGMSPTNSSPNQWKLELGIEGEIRCTVVTRSAGAIWARSSVLVTDGKWHTVNCTKTDRALSIKVDGADPVTVPLPPDLELNSPNQPLRLGGNNRMGSGRFTGAVDNVYYRLD